MKVIITEGSHTKEALQKCYDYILKIYKERESLKPQDK